LVDNEIDRLTDLAQKIPSGLLREQALASLKWKRFHAEGGSAFAMLSPGYEEQLVPLIVSLQTISDYLDNLVDRNSSFLEADFRLLHQAMVDAVGYPGDLSDYYARHQERDDGGYLNTLVAECRNHIQKLPFYHLVAGKVESLIKRYCDLQVYKHLPLDLRKEKLVSWHDNHPFRHKDLTWWEFAAACGSTLGVFVLLALACQESCSEHIKPVSEAYFPWICSLHILLDYLIDQEEDIRENDLNFVSFYSDQKHAYRRINSILSESVKKARALPQSSFHIAVIEGLLALYLTDPKVEQTGLQSFSLGLISSTGWRGRLAYYYCRRWRRQRAKKGCL
jgi:tetraprenyl-beta-curcumene synthase